MSDSLWPQGLQYARLPCSSLSPGVCSDSCALSWWCHPTILSSVTLFSSCPQSLPASGSFLMSWLFVSGGQNIGASASKSVLPMNIQDWLPLGLSGLISLLSKELSRVLSITTVWKHPFFRAQSPLWSSFYICSWLLEIYGALPLLMDSGSDHSSQGVTEALTWEVCALCLVLYRLLSWPCFYWQCSFRAAPRPFQCQWEKSFIF